MEKQDIRIDYNTLFEIGTVMVVVWESREGWPIAHASQNTGNILGYDADSLQGRLYMDLVHPDDIDKVREEVEVYLYERRSQWEQEYRIRKSDGSYIWVRDFTVPVWEGQILQQINGYIYDVSVEIDNRRVMKFQNTRLNQVIEATNVGTWEWHIPSGKVTANERFAEMCGYSLAEVEPLTIGTWDEWISPQDKAKFYEAVQDHLDGRADSYQMECRVRTKEGAYIWVMDRGKVMEWDDEGNPVRMIGAQTDVTEMKQTQAMLYHSEKLNALGRLAGGMAHDINNHLMMIGSYAALSKERKSLEGYEANMEAIEGIVARAADVVKQLMVFTRQSLFEAVPTDMVEILRNVEKMARHTFGRNISIVTGHTIGKIMADVDQSLIENALINLCINARDAMPDGGTIHLDVKKRVLNRRIHTYSGYLDPGNYCLIRIIDDGVGMEENELERIFEPFFTTKETGTGIGLSTVIGIVKQHDGGIHVVSQKGVGSAFTIYIPLMTKETEQGLTTMPTVIVEGGCGCNVLIVDDEPVIGQVLEEYLAMKGCHATTKTDPEEALTYFSTHHEVIDVVIMDMMMPRMSGDTLYRHMLAIDEDVKVLFLSGFSEGIHVSEQDRANIIGYLEKPVHVEKVFEALRHR